MMDQDEEGIDWDTSLDETGRFELSEDAKRLRDALFALNRAISAGSPNQLQLIRIRNMVWDLGVEMYGWSE